MTPFQLSKFKRLAENRTQKPLDYTGFAKDAEFLSYCWNNADAIISRIEKLEKALEFYADPINWDNGRIFRHIGDGKVMGDYGETARKALERGE